jgi:microcystin-dependent protein
MLMPYAGATAPTGWLLCYGQGVSTTTYADLFAAIGYTYGGSGSTFNLPDLRGRVVAGKDDMGGTSANRLTDQSGGLDGDVLGDTGGAETHTLTTTQIPSHSHDSIANVDAGYTSDGLTAGEYVNKAKQSPYGGGGEIFSYSLSGGTTAPTLGPTSSVGSGSAHNNVQPTIILTYIIKT